MAALLALLGIGALLIRRARGRRSRPRGAAILNTPTDDTSIDPETGAVTSKQGADIVLPASQLDGLWDPEHLERVARTYWRTMQRFTLGLIHVDYTPTERAVVLLVPQLRLLTFRAPEYEMNRRRGIVRWRIEKGLLVSSQGRDGDGYLEIDIERHDDLDGDRVRLHVDVEVANFYPALSGISRWFYVNTQSRIHVLACTFFLRRLVRGDLAASKVGQFAGPGSADQAPEPAEAPEPTPVDEPQTSAIWTFAAHQPGWAGTSCLLASFVAKRPGPCPSPNLGRNLGCEEQWTTAIRTTRFTPRS